MRGKLALFKDMGNRLLDDDITCFDIINQDFDATLSDQFFDQRSTVLLHDQEPLLFNAQRERWSRWRFNTSPFDDRMIILNSERNSKELNDFCKEFNAVPCHWFSNGALALSWYDSGRFSLRPKIKYPKPRLHYKFSCLNRLINHQRCYRPVISRILLDLVDHKHLRLSCMLTDPSDGSTPKTLPIPSRFMHLFNNIDFSTPIRVNHVADDVESNGSMRNLSADMSNQYFVTTFCHIVTETLFTESTLHLTEKSLRPFVNLRPFLLLGPPHSLSYLRSYGFKTFSEFWDESYDSISDPWQRLEAVIKVVENLNKMSLNDMDEMLDAMDPILRHNYRHFYMDFPERIMDDLSTNFKDAITSSKSREPNGWMLKRLKELTPTRINELMNGPMSDEIPNNQLYDSLKLGDMTKVDRNLARLLTIEKGFDKESSKEEILARFKIALD